MSSQLKSRGAALIAALLVVAIAASLSAAIAVRLSRWLDGLRLEQDGAQAQQIVRAALDWSGSVLEQDARMGATDHLGEAWAQPSPLIPVEQEGDMQGRLQDAAARFNLNNLRHEDGSVDALWLAAYQRLLQSLGLPIELAPTLAQWLASHGEGSGAMRWPADLRPARRSLRLVGEVAAVPGYTPAVVARLLPFVTALPGRTAINANTAGPEVLSALAEQGGAGVATLLAERARLPYRDKADLLARLNKAGVTLDGKLVDVASNWFLLSGQVRFRDTRLSMEALLNRDAGHTRLVWWSDR